MNNIMIKYYIIILIWLILMLLNLYLFMVKKFGLDLKYLFIYKFEIIIWKKNINCIIAYLILSFNIIYLLY